jgi:hypothetical protein
MRLCFTYLLYPWYWAALWIVLCASLYIAHVTYLSSMSRFDYGFNMAACIIIGSLQTNFWLICSIKQYTRWGNTERRPFAWMVGVSVLLVTLAMCLEVFDFPPSRRSWTLILFGKLLLFPWLLCFTSFY